MGCYTAIAAPVHGWQTLLAILMQAQDIKKTVVGPTKTIALDMGLYKPAKQVQMAREDLGSITLRPGELHISCVLVVRTSRTVGLLE